MKWHNLPPVNGRTIDVEDITKSWDRFVQLASYRADIAHAINPNAQVVSMTATDSRTIVIKLKEPISYLPAMLATNANGTLKQPTQRGGLYLGHVRSCERSTGRRTGLVSST